MLAARRFTGNMKGYDLDPPAPVILLAARPIFGRLACTGSDALPATSLNASQPHS
jgi:hypothetical protein